MDKKPDVFTIVGDKNRCPYKGMHPDCWEKPHRGIVLSELDPIAWRATLAFPGNEYPDPLDVAKHVQRVSHITDDRVPVLWYFIKDCGIMNPVHSKVMWEEWKDLEPWDEIYKWWIDERDKVYKERSLSLDKEIALDKEIEANESP